MSPGKECFGVTNVLLAQTSRIEYENCAAKMFWDYKIRFDMIKVGFTTSVKNS